MTDLHNLKYHIPSFSECCDLVDKYDCFIRNDDVLTLPGGNTVTLASFTYKLGNYATFMHSGALNMRGTTYHVETEEIVALPFWKFFNHGENPFTDPKLIETWDIAAVREKVDGSMINFFEIENKIFAKTKGTCKSPQSIMAEGLMQLDENVMASVKLMIRRGQTPIYEYTSPDNQIVIPYPTSKLVYLGCRNMDNGKYIAPSDSDSLHVKDMFGVLSRSDMTVDEILSHCKTSDLVEEGYVVEFTNGELVKYKTQRYVNLHHTIDTITNRQSLAKLILSEQIDDLFPLLPVEYHQNIKEFQAIIIQKYNHLLKVANWYYEQNKQLSQKEYAINASKQFRGNKRKFSLCMALYNQSFNEPKFKESLVTSRFWEES